MPRTLLPKMPLSSLLVSIHRRGGEGNTIRRFVATNGTCRIFCHAMKMHHHRTRQSILISRKGESFASMYTTTNAAIGATQATSPESACKVPPSPSSLPTWRQLRLVALRSAIPMIGFGFMDNIVMIQAGEAIDISLGVAFSLSTLTAAGFGQCVSDVAGITCGGVVDAAVAKLNLKSHGLTPAQLNLKQSRISSTVGGCLGVVCGCLLGMTSLLFMDTDRADRMKKARELDSIFKSVMDEGHEILNAQRGALWMWDHDKKELWTRVATGTKDIIRVKDTTGVVGCCVSSGKVVNIHDAYKDGRFNQDVDKRLGFRTKSMLTVPIKNRGGDAVGAIQMMNKMNDDGSDGTFTLDDVKLLTMLSSHVSAFIRVVHEDES